MKAHEILMFLLIFNLVLWLLGGYGLNLYNMGVYGNKTGIKDATDVLEGQSSSTDIGNAFLVEIVGTFMAGIILTASSLAVMGYLLRAVPTPQSVVYAMFGGFFWTTYLKTLQVFYSITKSIPFIAAVVLLVFTAITVYTFIFGFSQIVSGGWRYMK